MAVTTPNERLPRGPHKLAREAVLASQRGRILEAMADGVAEKGYPATTVADVVARAGVSRKTFYEQFTDKEDCFLAAYDVGVELLAGLIARAEAEAGNDWLARLKAGSRAFLDTLAAEPAFARTYLIEVLAAGPHALERRAQVMRRFASDHRALYARARVDLPALPELPDEIFDAMIGAGAELVAQRVREGRTAELAELQPTLLYMQLALFAGHEVAAQETGETR